MNQPIKKTNMESMQAQVKSRERVAKYAEVFTSPREVNAMLDLIKQETKRINSRFLEPACGEGIFLTEVLSRKLRVVEENYIRSQLEFEYYLVIAVSSIYGIDKLQDNVLACRQLLFDIANVRYTALFKKKARNDVRQVIKYLLSRNIICGNALTLKTEGENPEPIVFSKWEFIGNKVTRDDFIFEELIPPDLDRRGQIPMFAKNIEESDLGEKVFVPKETRRYPPVHYLKVEQTDD